MFIENKMACRRVLSVIVYIKSATGRTVANSTKRKQNGNATTLTTLGLKRPFSDILFRSSWPVH